MMFPLEKTSEPTMYFIGVTTRQSAIMKVFPRWAKALGIDAVLKGIDLEIHGPRDDYRQVVELIKQDPLSLGALVTTHKIDLLCAARDLFDRLDHHATVLGEVSSLSKRESQLWGHAKDPLTSGLALEAFLPPDWWRQTGAEALIFGAGGSALAVSIYLMDPRHGRNRPAKIVVTNRSKPRLESMRSIHETLVGTSCDWDLPREYHHCPTIDENDRVLAGMHEHSLIINATGLGKNRPGSPVTDKALFPRKGLVWDFNYRGDLGFLAQARSGQEERELLVEDGWIYFLHGWTQVISEVFHVKIDPEKFTQLERLANDLRQDNSP